MKHETLRGYGHARGIVRYVDSKGQESGDEARNGSPESLGSRDAGWCDGRMRRGRTCVVRETCRPGGVTRNRSAHDGWPVGPGLGKVKRFGWACFSSRTGEVLSRAASGNSGARRLIEAGPSSGGAIGAHTGPPATRAAQRSPAKIQRPTSRLRRLRQSIRHGLQRRNQASYTPWNAGSQRRNQRGRCIRRGHPVCADAFAGHRMALGAAAPRRFPLDAYRAVR